MSPYCIDGLQWSKKIKETFDCNWIISMATFGVYTLPTPPTTTTTTTHPPQPNPPTPLPLPMISTCWLPSHFWAKLWADDMKIWVKVKIVTYDTPSLEGEYLHQIWKESLLWKESHGTDMISLSHFLAKLWADWWPWRYGSRSKVVAHETPSLSA